MDTHKPAQKLRITKTFFFSRVYAAIVTIHFGLWRKPSKKIRCLCQNWQIEKNDAIIVRFSAGFLRQGRQFCCRRDAEEAEVGPGFSGVDGSDRRTPVTGWTPWSRPRQTGATGGQRSLAFARGFLTIVGLYLWRHNVVVARKLLI